MKILVAAYKFGTEREMGEHLGTYHYFIEMMRRLQYLGNEIVVVAPWLTFWKCGSREIDGVKIFRYYPPLWNSAKWFFLSRPLRSFYLWATQRIVLRLDRQRQWDAILVWQARETGYAVARIASKLSAPFLFRQITAWQWHLTRSVAQVFGQKKWYQLFLALRFLSFLNPILEWLLDRATKRRYAQAIYQAAAKILFVSKAAARAEDLNAALAEKIAIWPVGIETEIFAPHGDKLKWRQSLGIRGKFVLLFIGRISFAEKGIGYLLEAMPKILRRIPDVNLVIIGAQGESQRLQQLIEKLNIAEHVKLVGVQPFERLADYLQATDVLLVPSIWIEHFGQVTIEAMAAGVAVVTTNLGGSPEINLHNQTGLVVPPANAQALAEAAIRLLSDDNLRARFGQAARQRVLENYTYEVLIKQLIEIIHQVKKI